MIAPAGLVPAGVFLFVSWSGHSVADWTLKRSGDAKKSKIRIANKPALNNNSHAKQLT